MVEHKWPGCSVKTEADVLHEQYYPALHLNGGAGASPFHNGKETKHFPFLTDHGDTAATAFGCQPFTITPSSESSSNSSRHSNGKMFAHDAGLDNCALSLLSDNPQIMNSSAAAVAAQPLGGGGGGGAGIQYGGGGGAARLANDGDVSLTGLSYVNAGHKGTSIPRHAAVTSATSAAATQLQYHGYYQLSADQGNADGAMQALPFSSW